MQTVYDWLSMACFSGLMVLFLQRSMAEHQQDEMIRYLPPALGCAISNYTGNSGYPIVAIALLIATVGYIFVVLKPFKR